MGLEIGDQFLRTRVVLHNLLLDLLRLDAHLEDFIDDFLKILYHVVVLGFKVLVSLVDDVDKHLSVVLQRTTQCFQVVINQLRELVYSIIECCEVSQDSRGKRILQLFQLAESTCLSRLHHLVEL